MSPERNLIVTASDDKTARMWDLSSGELRQVLRASVGEGGIGRLYGAAIHPTDDWIAVGGTTGSTAGAHRILIFSIASGRFLTAFDARGGDIKQLAWSSDGTMLIAAYAGEHALRVFDKSGQLLYERRLDAPVYGLSTGKQGLVAATALDGNIVVLEARENRVRELRVLRAGNPEAVSAAFSPDGSKLVIGFLKQATAPELLDVRTGQSLGRMSVPEVRVGNFMSVAWSADSSLVAAAGSARDQERGNDVFFFDASNGGLVSRQAVATDTILDLKALTDRRFAYASFDGSWGVVAPQAVSVQVPASIADMRGANHLLLSPDARTVQWSFDAGERIASFDFTKRIVSFGRSPPGMKSPLSKAGWTDGSSWENTRSPVIRGRAYALSSDETSRALAYFSDRRSALLGTSQRLIRLDSEGRTSWQVRTVGEVRAVNLSDDGRLAVTAMSDGSLRWWRTVDGTLLLSLLVARDGRWIAWTETGFFDASAGADKLAGWSVNRADSPTADFYSLSRFRARYNRPEAIDQVLQTHEKVAETALSMPPVLESAELAAVEGDAEYLVLPYTVRTGSGGEVDIELRVDGRPADGARILDQATKDEQTRGRLRLRRPGHGSLLQLVARNAHGVSEPLGFIVQTDSKTIGPDSPPQSPSGLSPELHSGPPLGAPPGAVVPGDTSGRVAAVQAITTPSATVLKPVPPVMVTAAMALPIAIPPPASLGPTPQAPLRRNSIGGSRLFVLAIGISNYRNPDYRLGLAAKDAMDFSDVLKSQNGRLYSDVIVRTLTDAQATRRSVIDHLHWLSESAGPADIGMLFFAGHGLNASEGQYYFLPHDADHERLADTAIPEEELRKALGRMRGKALLFVDTCFGGAALSRAGSSELARMANNLSAAENGVVVFASSSGRQLSEEKDAWGNGAFTKAVLAGLSGKADLTRSGRVTFKGLDFYISEEVNKLTEGRQTPVTISPTGVPDFALARVGMT